jgi:hypothetical protein
MDGPSPPAEASDREIDTNLALRPEIQTHVDLNGPLIG